MSIFGKQGYTKRRKNKQQHFIVNLYKQMAPTILIKFVLIIGFMLHLRLESCEHMY